MEDKREELRGDEIRQMRDESASVKHTQTVKNVTLLDIKDEYFGSTPFPVSEFPKMPQLGFCIKCKEWTFYGGRKEPCCGMEYVRVD